MSEAQPSRATRRAWAWLAIVLLAALVVRALRLDEGFWIDEVISVDVASRDWIRLVMLTGLGDVHPPLYYGLLKVWTTLFGSGDVAARALSVVLGIGSVGVLFGWVHGRSGLRAALFAGLYLALSTFHLHYAIEVRSYALLVLLTLGSLAAYERWLAEPGRLGRLALVAILQALALWTHYYGALWAVLLNVHFFLGRHDARAAATWWATAQLAVLAAFSPWLPLLLVQVFHLPEVITAHLTTSLPLTDVLDAFGPAAAHPVAAVATVSGALVLAAAAVAALVPTAPPASGDAAAPPLSRPVVAATLVVLAIGPLWPLALPLSELTFELVASELPRAYGLLVGAGALLAVAARVRRARSFALPVAAPAVLVLGAPLLIAGLNAARPTLFIRNLLIFLPPALALLAPWVARRPVLAHGLTWVALPVLAIPSILHGAEGFQPRQDFAGVAELLADAPSRPVAVLPAWDAPGVDRYLDPAPGRLVPLTEVGALPAPGAWGLDVVLTRQAARPDGLRADVLRHLGRDEATAEVTLQGLWGGIRVLRFSPP